MKMKLFKISQVERGGYDTFDSAIVAAENERGAAQIHPNDYPNIGWQSDSWASSPENVKVEYIGEAAHNIVRGLILASFNAG